MQHDNTARTNMVDSQIHTMGVVNEAVLKAFSTIRREEFVSPNLFGVAYSDEDLPLGQGRFVMEPITHARLIQALNPRLSDNVLDIGAGTGYSSAIFAGLCSKVVAVEPSADLLALAKANWAKMGFGNIIAHHGPFLSELTQGSLYDIIFINGSLAQIPESLTQKLLPLGRLVCVVKTSADKIGKATLVTKNESGVLGKRVLFDAATPYLLGQEPNNNFVF